MPILPGPAGLVYSVTSDKRPAGFIVEPAKKRLGRMRKAVITGARLLVEDLQRGGVRHDAILITLTYSQDGLWGPRDVTGLVKHMREWCRRQATAFRYVWVLELTQRGRPHYHMLVFVRRGLRFPKPDARGWWRHGMTRIERARNAVGYAAKYASKGIEAGDVPKGARLHGCGGLERRSLLELRWWMLPRWVREVFDEHEHRPEKVPGGWLSRLTGELLKSPWVMVQRARDWSWIRLVESASR